MKQPICLLLALCLLTLAACSERDGSRGAQQAAPLPREELLEGPADETLRQESGYDLFAQAMQQAQSAGAVRAEATIVLAQAGEEQTLIYDAALNNPGQEEMELHLLPGEAMRPYLPTLYYQSGTLYSDTGEQATQTPTEPQEAAALVYNQILNPFTALPEAWVTRSTAIRREDSTTAVTLQLNPAQATGLLAEDSLPRRLIGEVPGALTDFSCNLMLTSGDEPMSVWYGFHWQSGDGSQTMGFLVVYEFSFDELLPITHPDNLEAFELV